MILSVLGKHKNFSKKQIREASHFFASEIMHPKTKNRIEVTIIFNKEETKDCGIFGYVEWLDTNHRPSDYMMWVDPTCTKEQLLKTLAHEFVHVDQFATGQLKDYIRANKVRWKNGTYKSNTAYENAPWEQQAIKMEKILYDRYIKNGKK